MNDRQATYWVLPVYAHTKSVLVVNGTASCSAIAAAAISISNRPMVCYREKWDSHKEGTKCRGNIEVLE